MRNAIVLLGALSLAGCGGDSDAEQSTHLKITDPVVIKPVEVKPIINPIIVKPIAVKPIVKLEPEIVVDLKDTALPFFNTNMYLNGSANIKYMVKSDHHQPYELVVNTINQRAEYEDKISHRLNYKDTNGNVHTEYYVVDVQNKVIIKTDESILYGNGTYETSKYMGKNIQFDFNLEKGKENFTQFNTKVFDSSLQKIEIMPTKVITKYLGLEKIEAGDISYNSGKFEIIEENKLSTSITTTWFDIDNGVIIKQVKSRHNIKDNIVIKNVMDIVDSSVNFKVNMNDSIFAKFKLDFMNKDSISNNNINLYTGVNNPIVVNVINNTIKVSGYDNNQFMSDSITNIPSESHSNGILSSFVHKIQYGRECDYNCSGPEVSTFYMLGVRDNYDSHKYTASEYAGKYAWYRVKESMRPSDYFIVMDLKDKICHISTRTKLNIYECLNLDVDVDHGQITAIVIEKGKGTYGSLFAYINGNNNEYITGVVRSKGDNDDSVDTFIIKKR